MNIQNTWNNGTKKQRTDLLKSVYGDAYIMFASDCEKDWYAISCGVKRRLNMLVDVYNARNAK